MKYLDVDEFLRYKGVYVWQIETTKTANIWNFSIIYYADSKKVTLSLAGAEYDFNIKEFEELVETLNRILSWVKKRVRVRKNVSKRS